VATFRDIAKAFLGRTCSFRQSPSPFIAAGYPGSRNLVLSVCVFSPSPDLVELMLKSGVAMRFCRVGSSKITVASRAIQITEIAYFTQLGMTLRRHIIDILIILTSLRLRRIFMILNIYLS